MNESKQPLAYRLRPNTIDDVIGQAHLVGPNGFLRQMVNRQQLVSLIFFGPPGTGKTTLAYCIANDTHHPVRFFNAVTGNKKDLTAIFAESEFCQNSLVLIIDEVHRLNKDKQDLLLPYLENGSIILLGCTTSNPAFAINPAIRSRCHCLSVHALDTNDIVTALKRALIHKDGFNGEYTIEDDAALAIAKLSNGDVRYSLNCLQAASFYCDENHVITTDVLSKSNFVANSSVFKDGDGHYDAESGLQKSIRGSDVNAALYYLARLVAADDFESIERRLPVIAYEDVGLANPAACARTITALQAARMVGFPEARIILANAVIELALSPKSKSAEVAIDAALATVKNNPSQVPAYLRLTPVGLAEDEKYSYERSDLWPYIQYLPDNIKDKVFYVPQSSSSFERQLKVNYDQLAQVKRTSNIKALNHTKVKKQD